MQTSMFLDGVGQIQTDLISEECKMYFFNHQNCVKVDLTG